MLTLRRFTEEQQVLAVLAFLEKAAFKYLRDIVGTPWTEVLNLASAKYVSDCAPGRSEVLQCVS